MDLKALIAKMDQIESKKFLTESKDKGDMDHDGKDEEDSEEWKQNRDAAIKKATGKEEKEVKESEFNFKGSIAQALLKEFGLDERVSLPSNPYTGADAEKFASMSPEDQAWLTKGGGKPDISGQGLKNGPDFNPILAHAPNKGKPVAAAPAIDADATDMSMGAAGRANAADAAAGATDMSLGQAGAANAAAKPPAAQSFPVSPQPTITSQPEIDAGATDMSMGAAGAANAADAAAGATDASLGAAGAANATAAKIQKFKDLLNKAEKPASAQAQPASAANKPAAAGGTYQIKPGDNLTKIAKANGTTIQAIMAANPQIKDPNKIQAGAKLTLPGGAQSSGQPAGPAAAPKVPSKSMGADSSAYDTQDPSNISSMPAAESISRLINILAELDRK